MRLLTLSSLRCLAKDVVKGYPLSIEIVDFDVKESDFNQSFIIHILPTIDWETIRCAARGVGLEGIPDKYDESLLLDQNFLKAMHNLLLDIHVNQGYLVCPESGRRFPIENGLPNMILPENEV